MSDEYINYELCATCDGAGVVYSDNPVCKRHGEECPTCLGTGRANLADDEIVPVTAEALAAIEAGLELMKQDCPMCGGCGYFERTIAVHDPSDPTGQTAMPQLEQYMCEYCGGHGVIYDEGDDE